MRDLTWLDDLINRQIPGARGFEIRRDIAAAMLQVIAAAVLYRYPRQHDHPEHRCEACDLAGQKFHVALAALARLGLND